MKGNRKLREEPRTYAATLPKPYFRTALGAAYCGKAEELLPGVADESVDPFAGSCTTGEAAEQHRRKWIGFELRSDYLDGAHFRFEKGSLSPGESQSAVIPKNSHAQQREMALF